MGCASGAAAAAVCGGRVRARIGNMHRGAQSAAPAALSRRRHYRAGGTIAPATLPRRRHYRAHMRASPEGGPGWGSFLVISS